jgi:hypothetical protein
MLQLYTSSLYSVSRVLPSNHTADLRTSSRDGGEGEKDKCRRSEVCSSGDGGEGEKDKWREREKDKWGGRERER